MSTFTKNMQTTARLLACGLGMTFSIGTLVAPAQAWAGAPVAAPVYEGKPSLEPVDAAGGYDAFQAHAKALHHAYKQLVPDAAFLAESNATARDAVAAEGVELLEAIILELNRMIEAKPNLQRPIQAVRENLEAECCALGHAPTLQAMQKQVQAGGELATQGRRILLRGQWFQAGQNAAMQRQVMDRIATLAADAPSDVFVTQLVADIALSQPDAQVKSLALSLLGDTLDNPMAKGMLNRIANNDTLHALESKPMVIEGHLMDGETFTTEAWKGKVILVDFWATWCGPCVAELPRVKKAYAEFHDQGFEVLGIANDTNLAMLKNGVEKLELPWPQLFDQASADQGQWHTVTRAYGIDGIPVMLLIDKQGVCRTVTAREDFETLIPQMLAE